MKRIDQIYHVQVPSQGSDIWQLRCHLRIFQAQAGVQTVVVTEMGFELGWFIPYLLETLANQIVQEFDLDPAKLIWLERYSSDYREQSLADFSQVTFEWQNGKAASPKWTTIAPVVVERLIREDLQLLSA
jgi:hypothetical protein